LLSRTRVWRELHDRRSKLFVQAFESQVKDRQTDKCQTRPGTDRTVQEKKYPALAEAYQERIYFEDELRFGTRTTLKGVGHPKVIVLVVRSRLAMNMVIYTVLCVH
jgi:hypothetical protein